MSNDNKLTLERHLLALEHGRHVTDETLEAARFFREALAATSEKPAAAAERDTLAAELARLREDAERYRWLRRSLYWDGHAWWIPDLWVSSPDVRSLSQSDDVPYPTDTEIDASVDHAIAADARKKG